MRIKQNIPGILFCIWKEKWRIYFKGYYYGDDGLEVMGGEDREGEREEGRGCSASQKAAREGGSGRFCNRTSVQKRRQREAHFDERTSID